MFQDPYSQSAEESKQRMTLRLADSEHLVDTQFIDSDERIMVFAVVRGMAGREWLVDELQTKPKMTVYFADLLTRELIYQAEQDVLRDFERLLPDSP